MRFIQNGPNIPEELFIARDEGRVVFFCGAGVSRHRVNLPDFVSLTKSTMEDLGLDEESPTHNILKLMQLDVAPNGCQELLEAAPSAVTADKIFSILETDFFTEDIERL